MQVLTHSASLWVYEAGLIGAILQVKEARPEK